MLLWSRRDDWAFNDGRLHLFVADSRFADRSSELLHGPVIPTLMTMASSGFSASARQRPTLNDHRMGP